MRKRLLYAAIGVVGLVLAALGVASATVWRADDVLVATATADEHTVITDAGVLEMAGDAVTVRATAGSADPVTLVVGRDTDVLGWVGDDPHQRVSGLDGWHELRLDAPAADPTAAATDAATAAATDGATQPPAEDATAAADEAAEGEAADEPTAVDPAGSDMWVLEATGEGSAELEWTVQAEGRWSVMAVSTGATPPTISLAWPQTVTTPWLWPAAGAGALLVALSLLLLMRDVLRARRGDGSGWTAVATGSTPVVEAGAVPAGLTRRQMRELQAGGRPGTQSLPVVPTVVRAAPEPVVVPGRSDAGSSAPDRAAASDAPDAAGAGGRRSRRASGQGDAPPRRPGLRSLGRRGATPEQPAPASEAPPAAAAGAPGPRGTAGTPSPSRGRGEERVPSTPGAPTGSGPRPAWLADRGPAPSPGPAHPSASAPGDPAPGRGQGPTTSAWGPRPSTSSQAPTAAGPTRGPGPAAPGRAVPPRPGAPVGTVPPAGPGPSGARSPGGPAGPGTPAGRAGSQARPGWAPTPPAPDASGRAPRPDVDGPPPGGRPRPAWSRGEDADGDAGSRADAWRRAWGMPPVPGTDDTREEDR